LSPKIIILSHTRRLPTFGIVDNFICE